MPSFDARRIITLAANFTGLIEGLDDRLEQVVQGRVVPVVSDIAIGGARKLKAACLFFDIRGFSDRTGSEDDKDLKQALYMLDCVIPTVMDIIHDYGGYIEKNTGDGVMAIIGAEAASDSFSTSKAALGAALDIFYTLKNIINPHLESKGISPVHARIGIDMGTILIARIGRPTGSAERVRNFLTAVGPTANVACRMQEHAGTDEIWVGDQVKHFAPEGWQHLFHAKMIPGWNWHYVKSHEPYNPWHFRAAWKEPT